MKKEWYCYICGKKLKKVYFLISLSKSFAVDRVFLVCNKTCVEQIDMSFIPIIIKVRETR